MSTRTSGRYKILFWGLMIIAQAGAFLIFKSLADLSQWWIQSDREFTMAVWYNRWALAIVMFSALAGCLYLWWRHRELASVPVCVLLVGLCLFNWYAGFLNPGLMFRAQQNPGEALFVSVDEAPRYLREMLYASYDREQFDSVDEISVIVLETDHGARAYTDYYLLQPHVVEGGIIDDEPVVMTYCGLTNMGIAYSPVIEGQALDLRAINQLRNNLLMVDSNTGEPIQQMWGTLERDGESGPAMQQWPTLRMPFGTFRQLYPEGQVYINGISQQSGNPLVQLFDYLIRDGVMVHALRKLQWQSDEPAFPTITEFDDSLPRKQLVYGLNIGDDAVAYTKRFVAEQGGLLNVAVGNQPLVIYYDADMDTLAAFYNSGDAPVGSVDLFGRSDRGNLSRVESLKSGIFWFIWYDFNRHTDLNRV